ncbi:MAG: hypothetical protein IE909_04565, partial [Campylobacterales bacterium]|nr:hypothetical protein [Campylobacterales bacterium]
MRASKEDGNLEDILNAIETNNFDFIKDKVPKLVKSYQKLLKRTDKILKQSDMQQLEVLKLTERIEASKKKINNLLDNASDGFLYFGKDMLI